jgi:hypothetical protein
LRVAATSHPCDIGIAAPSASIQAITIADSETATLAILKRDHAYRLSLEGKR